MQLLELTFMSSCCRKWSSTHLFTKSSRFSHQRGNEDRIIAPALTTVQPVCCSYTGVNSSCASLTLAGWWLANNRWHPKIWRWLNVVLVDYWNQFFPFSLKAKFLPCGQRNIKSHIVTLVLLAHMDSATAAADVSTWMWGDVTNSFLC